MILDTCFVIDFMDNDEKAVAKLRELELNNEPTPITSLTIFELFSGLARSSSPDKEKEKVINVLSGQTILPFDGSSAEKAGEIDGGLAKKGEKIDAVDSMIAGITIFRKEKVLTRNVKDFSKVKGLDIETY